MNQAQLKFSVITLFPQLIKTFSENGVFSGAIDKQILALNLINPRDFTEDKHKTVDDRPFGGGDGMLMLVEPLKKAFESLGAAEKSEGVHRIYLSPQGKPLTEKKAKELAQKKHLVLLCGRYGGIDQRVLNNYIDEEISIGDYVLSGGELPACVLMETVSRFVPDVLGHGQSAIADSFTMGRLEEPQFTRPREILGQKVPEMLLSGDHKAIEGWKKKVSWLNTYKKRPDLVSVSQMSELRNFEKDLSVEDRQALGFKEQGQFKAVTDTTRPMLAVGLLHHPIMDREKKIVATNITNFDIHDIARAATVLGVDKYYLIHPMDDQLMFVQRILEHWRVGLGAKFNPFRKTALENVHTAKSLKEAVKDWGQDALVIGTHARPVKGTQFYTCNDLKKLIFEEKRPVFLLFGTGFGMTDEYMQDLDGVLESIKGAPPADYRHLSVRSAVSIYLDRILGPW